MGRHKIGDTVNGLTVKTAKGNIWINDYDVDFFDAARRAGVRHDWHEPDEQGLTATVEGKSFDNAGHETEKHLVLKKDGQEIGSVNLATLCAFAAELVRREKAAK
jgi:hypothetical protein